MYCPILEVECPYDEELITGEFCESCIEDILRSESESGSDVYEKTASTETGAVPMVVAGAERSQ